MSSNTSTLTPSAWSKPLRYLSYTLIGLMVFVSLLPVAIRYAAQYSLVKLGADKAYIDDVDLNLFTGTAALKGVQIEVEGKPTLSLHYLGADISITALFKKHVLIEKLFIQGLDLRIFQQQDTWIVAIPLPESDEQEEVQEPSAWRVGIQSIEFEQVAVQAHYLEQDFSVELHELVLSELLMWQPDQLSPFKLRGAINKAPLLIDSQLEPFSTTPFFAFDLQLKQLDLSPLQIFLPNDIQEFAAKLDIDTKVEVTLDSEGALNIMQQGEVAIRNSQVKMDDLHALLNTVAWQGKLQINLDSQQKLNLLADGVAETSLKSLQLDDIEAAVEQVKWQGIIDLALDEKQQAELAATGELSLANVLASYQPLLLSTTLEQFNWAGSSTLVTENIDESLALNGNAQFKQWNLQDNQREASLASFASFTLDSLAIEGLSDISLGEVELTRLQALQTAEQALASIEQIQLQTVQLKESNHLLVDSIILNQIGAQLSRNSHGNIAVLDDWLPELLQRFETVESTEIEPETASLEGQENSIEGNDNSSPFQFRINQIAVRSDVPLVFSDQGVQPTVKHQLVLADINLGRIDSQEQAYETPLELYLKLYQHGRLTVKGQLTPLQDIAAINGKLTAEIKGIELTDISPYIEEAIGYQARSGQFNSETEATIKQGKLDSETKIRIQRIDLKPSNEEIMAQASQSIAMPVSTALKIITDKNNTLRLTVPINGDLSEPDVKVNKIMSEAITQAVKNTAMTYFKFAVQPFGAIVMVSQAIGNAKLQARFEDVRFEPGTADMVKEQKGYLAKVAQMIQEKKDFSVVACVYVTDEDFLARKRPPKLAEGEKYQWDDESKALAAERLEHIRGSLIKQHGLDSDQIQSCKAQLGKGTPRAVMGI